VNKPHQGPRLKGLDEMPRRRRTLRERYFAAKSRVQSSKSVGWLWPLLQVLLVLALLWGIARVLGLPIEREIRELLRF
jgi:hypothetical protein